jgi:hypothetical protein
MFVLFTLPSLPETLLPPLLMILLFLKSYGCQPVPPSRAWLYLGFRVNEQSLQNRA